MTGNHGRIVLARNHARQLSSVSSQSRRSKVSTNLDDPPGGEGGTGTVVGSGEGLYVLRSSMNATYRCPCIRLEDWVPLLLNVEKKHRGLYAPYNCGVSQKYISLA